jgi:hypothetical protein
MLLNDRKTDLLNDTNSGNVKSKKYWNQKSIFRGEK